MLCSGLTVAPAPEFVIAHPNSYGLPEQTVLRKSLEEGGLIKKDDAVGAQRLQFVTEAEASVYFGLEHTPHQWLSVRFND